MIADRTTGKSTSFDYDALGRPVIKRSGSVSGTGHVIRGGMAAEWGGMVSDTVLKSKSTHRDFHIEALP
jgi:hypothetical protein